MVNVRKYQLEIWVITFFMLAYAAFCYYQTPECMHQAWFSHLSLLQHWFDHSLTLHDILQPFGEHGMLGYNLLLLFNTHFFQLNTRFDALINDFCVMAIGILALYHLSRWKKAGRDILYVWAILVICLSVFGFHQVSSTSMETQVRLGLLFSALIAHMANHCLIKGSSKRYLFGTVLVIIIGINVFGTMYSFALFPVLFLFAVVQMIRARKLLLPQAIISLTCVVVTVIYCVEYQIFGITLSSDSDLLTNILTCLSSPGYILKSLLVYNAGGLLGYAVFTEQYFPQALCFAVGIFMTVSIVLALILFFKTKSYRNTIFPLLLIGYSFFIWCFILIGRSGDAAGDYFWFANYWYTCHLKMQTVGVVIIFLQVFRQHDIVKEINHPAFPAKAMHRGLTFLTICVLLGIGISLVAGNLGELRRAPSERAWGLDKQMWLFADSEEDMPTDENGNTPLLYEKTATLQMISLLKEHSLGVYRYYGSYSKMMETLGREPDGTEMSIRCLSGGYDDKWLAKESQFTVQSGDTGILYIKLYEPYESYQSMAGQVVIDGESHAFTLNGELTVLEYPVEVNRKLDISIIMDEAIVTQNRDSRELSVLLSAMSCS